MFPLKCGVGRLDSLIGRRLFAKMRAYATAIREIIACGEGLECAPGEHGRTNPNRSGGGKRRRVPAKQSAQPSGNLHETPTRCAVGFLLAQAILIAKEKAVFRG